jgi:hypothetical protein
LEHDRQYDADDQKHKPHWKPPSLDAGTKAAEFKRYGAAPWAQCKWRCGILI